MHVLRRLLKAMTGSRFYVLGSCREAGYRSLYMCVWECKGSTACVSIGVVYM